jgi:hypothetical protein
MLTSPAAVLGSEGDHARASASDATPARYRDVRRPQRSEVVLAAVIALAG